MSNILMNWQELKAYFTCAELATDKMDAKYKAQLRKEMLPDDSNYLYFVFATTIVQELERVNSLFQQTKADAHTSYRDLQLDQQSLHNRLYDTNGRKRSIYEIDFGFKFLKECNHVQKKECQSTP